MEKKLIAFEDDQIKAINEWAEKYHKTFTEAVRKLVDIGIEEAIPVDEVSDNVTGKLIELEEEVKKLSWWTSDDNTSRLGNLETHVSEMQKSINVLTAAMKLFKKHISNREIHMQD